MTDSQTLMLVVVAIYYSECLTWSTLFSIAFQSWGAGRFRWVQPGKWFGNRSGGLLVKPIVPFGTCYLCQFWPMSISPDGVLSEAVHAFNLPFQPVQPSRYIPFEELHSVHAVDKDVQINGRLFCRTGSRQLAQYLAELVRRCQLLPAERRIDAIDQSLLTTLDLKAIRARLEDVGQQRAALDVLATTTFFLVFAISPLAVYQFGWLRTWLFLLIALTACVALTAILFRRVHRVLFPADPGHRRLHTALMVLNPLSAIRALDVLSAELLALFHPLAVAHALLVETQYQQFARQVLLDVRYPLQSTGPAISPQAADTEVWFRQKNLLAIETFLRSTGVDPESLIANETPLNETCRTYCPRCRAQYVLETGTCFACGGIPLVRF